MLSMTGRLGMAAHILFIGAFIVGYLIDTKKILWSISTRAANRIGIVLLLFSIIEWKVFGEFPVTVILNYIIYVSTLKLIRKKFHRDWLWLYLISFCQVLMCAGMTAGSTFLLMFVVYIFMSIAALIGCEIKRRQMSYELSERATSDVRASAKYYITPHVKSEQDKKDSGPDTFAAGRMLTSSGVILALIIFISIPMFLVMPRLNPGYSRSGYLPTRKLSGFSDSVKLGDIGSIKLNPQVVMRVRVKFSNDSERVNLKWRGVTLDYYDGNGWKQSNTGAAILHKEDESETFRIEDKTRDGGYTVQQFFVEPLDINTVFAAPRTIYLTGLSELIRDGGDSLWTEYHPYNKLEYRVVSDTHVPTDKQLATDDVAFYSKDIYRRYLQLPTDFDKRIQQLAAQITSNSTTKIETVRKLEQYLKSEFSYSLNMQRVDYGDPVADFLFNTKEGHCEYFASAMAVMLRSLKIPARLVNGFQTGEYNSSADVYTVRQSDAHSWVEAYFPNYGWIAFDPTPGVGLSVYEEGVSAWFRQQSEAVEMFWLENIIGFDAGKQVSIALQLQNWLSAGKGESWLTKTPEIASIFDSESANKRGDDKHNNNNLKSTSFLSLLSFRKILLAIIIVIVLTILFFMIKNQRNRSWKRIAINNPTHSASMLYAEMLNILNHRGITKIQAKTPAEFANDIAIPEVSKITSFYHNVRFGNKIPSPDELIEIESALKSLRK